MDSGVRLLPWIAYTFFGKGNSHESKQRQYRTISEESLMILADLMAFHLISAMMTKTSHNKMNIILCQLVQVRTIDNQNLRNEVKKLDQNPNLDLFQGQGDRLFSNLPIKLRYSFHPLLGWYLSLAGERNWSTDLNSWKVEVKRLKSKGMKIVDRRDARNNPC